MNLEKDLKQLKKQKQLKESAIAQLRKRSKEKNIARPRAGVKEILQDTNPESTLRTAVMEDKQDQQPPKTKKYFRSTKSGAGMTKAGVARYRRENPGSKLKTAVTGKVKTRI